MVAIDYDMIVFKEDDTYVAYCPELDVSSCGDTVEKAKNMLKTAVRLFLEEAEKIGTLTDILEESLYRKDATGRWLPPRLVATELVGELSTMQFVGWAKCRLAQQLLRRVSLRSTRHTL